MALNFSLSSGCICGNIISGRFSSSSKYRRIPPNFWSAVMPSRALTITIAGPFLIHRPAKDRSSFKVGEDNSPESDNIQIWLSGVFEAAFWVFIFINLFHLYNQSTVGLGVAMYDLFLSLTVNRNCFNFITQTYEIISCCII